jgi:hypothetical protein
MIIADTVDVQVGGNTVNFQKVGSLSVRVFESIYGKSQYHLRFMDRDASRWNKIAQQTDILVNIRIGAVTNVDTKGFWSKWKEARVTGLKLVSTADKIDVTITAEDEFFDFKRRATQRVFIKKSISEMIEAIAKEYILDTDLIETTDKYTLRQGWMTDFEFLTEELLPRARAKNPEEVFLLYIRQDSPPKLVFTSLDKQSRSGEPKLKFRWEPTGASKSEFDPLGRAFITEYTSTTKLDPSNFGTKTVTFDVNKAQGVPYMVSFLANDSTYNYPLLGATKPDPVSPLPAKVQSILMDALDLDFPTELKTRTDWKLRMNERVAISTLLLHAAQIGEIAEIDAKVVGGQKLFSSGRYLIYALYHIISGRGSKTLTFLERRGTVKGK